MGQRAKDLVVKKGHQPDKGILVDIRPSEKAIGIEKALGNDGGMGKKHGRTVKKAKRLRG